MLFFKKDHLFDLCGRLEQKIMQCVCFVTYLAFYTFKDLLLFTWGHARRRVDHSRLHKAGFSQNIKNIKTWMILFKSNNEVFTVHPGTSAQPCRYEEESEADRNVVLTQPVSSFELILFPHLYQTRPAPPSRAHVLTQ